LKSLDSPPEKANGKERKEIKEITKNNKLLQGFPSLTHLAVMKTRWLNENYSHYSFFYSVEDFSVKRVN
jgi:hypothetical protein